MALQRTPLYAAHQRAGGKLIEFGGWEMPVQYSTITDEHLCVRRAAGIFDISHMGEVLVSGIAAEAFLNATLTNDIRKLAVGTGQYTLMCNERGGVIDDLYVYRSNPEDYLLIINASRIADDVAWLERQHAAFPKRGEVSLKNVSDITAAVAIQGPNTPGLLDQMFPTASIYGTPVVKPSELKKNQNAQFHFHGLPVWVARTGYSGEDGFEIVAPAGFIEPLWDTALKLGHQFCLQPCGLGARDTLRTEMCYPLYGHELDENTTPIEAGLGFFVALDKGEFVGRSVLAAQKANGTTKKLAAFKMTDKSPPPRPHYAIFANGQKVGDVVSGTQSPSLNVGIGMGYVPPALAVVGTKIEIEIRGRRFAAEVVKKPIYKKR
ncbi:MAG: glycine cleavage system aminomethyltransferase GcvT [Verrucomicrobia bacterium]|nr:glycine cleavage system aminomethyltransferase GcvT [Verrucomicrobiota bacterium]